MPEKNAQSSNFSHMPPDETLEFNYPTAAPCLIKAVGVGGGGGNAVSHMFRQGIEGVSFALCNTDAAAMADSPIPIRVQLGDGLGAGGQPEVGRAKAEAHIDKIRTLLGDGTKMLFLTAGMGGGTGTGASPIIARVARNMGILTVGIVTIPFLWEGKKKIDRALDGVEALAKEVDSLLVVNNEHLLQVYHNLTVIEAFAQADDTLTNAARSIVELISKTGNINLDFEDVNNVLRNGGTSIISTGYGEGEHRVMQAIHHAIDSPLLSDGDVFNAKKILINIFHTDDPANTLNTYELGDLQRFMNDFLRDYEFKPGFTIDRSLGARVKVTILASGFGAMAAKESVAAPPTDTTRLEAEQQLADRRALYYPPQGRERFRKRHHNVYIFDNTELDDENLITQVSESPTGRRSRSALRALRPTPARRAPISPQAAGSAAPAAGDLISFITD